MLREDNRLFKMEKFVVIGIDGGTFDIILPFIEEGYLPNIKYLIDNGASGILKSTNPPFTPVAWTSFMTGKLPEKHKVYDFIEFDPVNKKTSITIPRNKGNVPFWEIINKEYKIGIADVPMTYPPYPINGFIITGIGAPSKNNFAYPEGLNKRLVKQGYQLYYKGILAVPDEKYLVKENLRIMMEKIKIFLTLIKEFKCDIFICDIVCPDTMQHSLWKYIDKTHPKYKEDENQRFFKNSILKCYKEIDNFIGNIFEIFGKDVNICVMSDHGFTSLCKCINLNILLLNYGFLKFKKSPKIEILKTKILTRLSRMLSEPIKILDVLNLRSKIPIKFKGILRGRINLWNIDFNNTKAYAFGALANIYVNQNFNKKDKIYKELIKLLLELKDPDSNNNIILDAKINNTDGSVPDIILLSRNGYWFTEFISNDVFSIYSPGNFTGIHNEDGMFILYGEKFKQNIKISANIIDVAPTILYALGYSIPEDYDGRVLIECFKEESKKRIYEKVDKPIISSISEYDTEEVIERLREIGYIE